MPCSKNNKNKNNKRQKYNCLTNSLTRYCNNNNNNDKPGPIECPTISASYYLDPETFGVGPNIPEYSSKELTLKELETNSGFLSTYFYQIPNSQYMGYYALYAFDMTMFIKLNFVIDYDLKPVTGNPPPKFTVRLTVMNNPLVVFGEQESCTSLFSDCPKKYNLNPIYNIKSQILQNKPYNNIIEIDYTKVTNANSLLTNFKYDAKTGENVYKFIMDNPSFTLNTVYKFADSVARSTPQIVPLSYELSTPNGTIPLPASIINNDYYSILNDIITIKNYDAKSKPQFNINGTFYINIINYEMAADFDTNISIYISQTPGTKTLIKETPITSKYIKFSFGDDENFIFDPDTKIYLYWVITSKNTNTDKFFNVSIGESPEPGNTVASSFDFSVKTQC
jgi:hypothetical protein